MRSTMGPRRGAFAIAALTVMAATLAPARSGRASATTEHPAALVARSRAALAGRATFSASGFSLTAGKRVGFSVRSSGAGRDASGTLSTRTAAGTSLLGFVRLGARLYVRGNARLWMDALGTSSTAAVAPLVGRWFVMPGASVVRLAAQIGAFTNPARLARFIKSGPAFGPFHLQVARRDRGHLVVQVASVHQVLEVTDDAGALPISLRAHDASGSLAIVFGYPTRLDLTAPAGAVPLSGLQATTPSTPATTPAPATG